MFVGTVVAEKIGLKIDSQVEVLPPKLLYHGTKIESLKSIKKEGLIPMSRQHVHLSIDRETAEIVAGRRKGDYIILEIEARKLQNSGHKVLISENGVFLTENVPANFIKT